MPNTLGFLRNTQSKSIHVSAPAEAAICVLSAANAEVAEPPDPPALKPNQPTHSMHIPMKVNKMLCGGCVS